MFGICVFGDSLTFGRGDNINSGWCEKLKRNFESQDYYNCLYNLGVCGDTTEYILKRFDVETKSRIRLKREGDRYIIIISVGLNDSRLVGENKTPQTEIKKFEENIQVLIQKAKKYTFEIMFIGLTPVDELLTLNYEDTTFTNERISKFNEIIKSSCQKNNILFFDMFENFSKLNYQELLGDGLHPNSQGYEEMYKLIKEFLFKQKVLR
ncbi:MAG: GDSL-type esterase/lipase family protein [Candidatus Woesearchaeota archaeon]